MSKAKQDYDSFAATYNTQYTATAAAALERELVGLALGDDLTGLTVLDLGGGSGIHAREAIARGAAAVDIVDISPGLTRVEVVPCEGASVVQKEPGFWKDFLEDQFFVVTKAVKT